MLAAMISGILVTELSRCLSTWAGMAEVRGEIKAKLQTGLMRLSPSRYSFLLHPIVRRFVDIASRVSHHHCISPQPFPLAIRFVRSIRCVCHRHGISPQPFQLAQPFKLAIKFVYSFPCSSRHLSPALSTCILLVKEYNVPIIITLSLATCAYDIVWLSSSRYLFLVPARSGLIPFRSRVYTSRCHQCFRFSHAALCVFEHQGVSSHPFNHGSDPHALAALASGT